MKTYIYLDLIIIIVVLALYHFHFFGLPDKIQSLIKAGSMETKRTITVLERRMQYKSKTGFSGVVEERNGSFYHLLGSWHDISFSDTNSAQASARKILEGIKPYIKCNPTQFGKSKVQYFGPDGCIIKFPQYIQGFEVENHQPIMGFGVENHPGITMHFITAKPGVANVFINVIPDSVYGSARLISGKSAEFINRELCGRTDSLGVKIKLVCIQSSHDRSSTPPDIPCEGIDPPAIDVRSPILLNRLYWRIEVPLWGTPHTFYIDAITGIQSWLVKIGDRQIKPAYSDIYKKQRKHIRETITKKFKAETGFEGDIEYNRVTGEFSRLWGTFPVYAVHNKYEARLMAHSVLKKYADYFGINLNQLKMESNQFGTSVSYKQEINGYEVEPHAEVEICLPYDEYEPFSYSSSFVPDIKVDTSSHISQAEAMKIFTKAISQKNITLFDSKLLISCLYSSDNPDQCRPDMYKLCWRIPYRHSYNGQESYGKMYIDAHTGKILGVRQTY